MTFPNEKAEIRAHEIEKTKAEIQVLTKKLSFLEDMQKHQKSPAEESYKRWWGEYPGTETWTIYDETRWVGFQKGYNTAYEETVSKFQPTTKSEGVFDEPKPKPKPLTLKQLLKKWEFDFAFKWENPKNRSSELYEEEVERFIQMFMEWMPDTIGDIQDDWDDGYNSYRNNLMKKLK